MADNITLPPSGTGTATPVCATEEIGGFHYQKIKLFDGTATSTAAIPGNVANGLDVDVTRVQGSVSVVQGTPGDLNATVQITDGTEIAAVDTSSRLSVAVGNTVTVTGTVTANAGTGTLQVQSNSANLATQTTAASIDGKITACNTGAVTIGTALPAGSANIGDVDVATIAAGDNNIGNVDIASVVPGTGATELGKAEDTALTAGATGVMALGVRSAAPSDRSAGPTDDDYEPFATNEVGAVWVSPTPSANGGGSTMNASSSDGATALTSAAQAIKASAGCLLGYYIYNPNSAAVFVQFYNTASGSVVVGTTNPLFMLTIPAASAANLWMLGGVAFSTAISWAAASTAGGNGAPTTALDAICWYK
jgi:hypothetical protein